MKLKSTYTVCAAILLLVVVAAVYWIAAGTGRGRETGWNARWIWYSRKDAPENSYVHFRKSFDLPAEADQAAVRVSADSRYKLWVNGRFVGRGPVRSDPRWQRYDEYDLAPFLRPGKNVIAVLVHYCGKDTLSYQLGRGGLLLDGSVRCGDSHVDISTGRSWKARKSDAWLKPRLKMNAQLGFSEIFNSRSFSHGWTQARFDDSGWRNAVVIGRVGMKPWTGMLSREIPHQIEEFIYPVRLHERGTWDSSKVRLEKKEKTNFAKLMSLEERRPLPAPAKDVRFPSPNIEDLLDSSLFIPDGNPFLRADGRKNSLVVHHRPEWGNNQGAYFVLDFGREVTGYPLIKVTTQKGCIIDLGYSELLENGRVDANRHGVRYCDRVIAGPGTLEYETFDKRAFRYMQIDVRGIKGDVTIETVGLKFSTYPVKWRGAFECSDLKLNKIWRLGAYTTQLNMEDAYTDCPWRERAQWWGDARIEALTARYAFGDTLLVRKGLVEIAHSQREDGMTACFAPGDPDFCSPVPTYTLLWIISIKDHYMWTGDIALLKKLYPNVKKAVGYFRQYVGEDGLLTDVPGWIFIDWAPDDSLTRVSGKITALNCFLYAALYDAAGMAEILGEKAYASECRKLAERVKQGINSGLFDKQKGIYADFYADGKLSGTASQQANSLAVLYDIAPREKWAGILDYIYNPANKVITAGTPYFSFYQVQALWHAGRYDQGLRYIRDNWGRMLDWGATTCWEKWTIDGSLCHGWSSGPTCVLSSHILGVRPKDPQASTFVIGPQPAGLAWARGVVPTTRGDIEVQWKAGRDFEIKVTLPPGTKAELVLPAAGRMQIDGAPAPKGVVTVKDGSSRLLLQAGTHTVKSSK